MDDSSKAMDDPPQSQHIGPDLPDDEPSTRDEHSPSLETTYGSSSQRPSDTQYEFIMQTGSERAESSTAAKRKLRTVRSHVMRNYLHQQQNRQGLNDSTIAGPIATRRQNKQLARRSRSTSFEDAQSPTPRTGAPSQGHVAGADLIISKFCFFGPIFELRLGCANHVSFAIAGTINCVSQRGYDQGDIAADRARDFVRCVIANKHIDATEPTYATLTAKVEVVTAVKDMLAVCGRNVPHWVVFAVSLLAYGCALGHDWAEAQGHIDALVRLVDTCGGMQALDFELQRTVTWMTYCLAATTDTKPIFPPPMYPDTRSVSLAFSDDAQLAAWRSAKRFPKNNTFVYDVMVGLQTLRLASSSEWHTKVESRKISNFQLQAMSQALAIAKEEPWTAILPGGARGAEMTTMFRVWSTALPLLIWSTTRQLRSQQCIDTPWTGHGPIISHIQELLGGADNVCIWPRGKCLEPVLVSLLYCVEACESNSVMRPWMLETVRKVTTMLKLEQLEDFRKTLEFFPMTEGHRMIIEGVWTELSPNLPVVMSIE